MKYFAYGSNMSEKRMLERDITIISRKSATLHGYRLIINKKSFKDHRIGFANIVEDINSRVEGILYEIEYEDVSKLDKFEGFPKHYNRTFMKIDNDEAIVYIATNAWISNTDLLTTKEYKNYLLEGKEFLSESYYEKLLEIKTL